MNCPRSFYRRLTPALTVCLAWPLAVAPLALAQAGPAAASVATYSATSAPAGGTYPATIWPSAPAILTTWPDGEQSTAPPRVASAPPAAATWVTAPADSSYMDTNVYLDGPLPSGPSLVDPHPPDYWFWQVLPEGVIYRSYQAGVHESRMALVLFGERDGRSLWDASLGGRVGIVRLGSRDPLHPQGWQLDFEGAAMPRLTLDDLRDLETVDFRFGVPLTYGIDNWQFKFGYYHLSSHLGDEFAIRNPGSLASRINYVRDALVLGASFYPHPAWRLYSEAGYATNATGGAEPWEFQFGTEYSQPGPTGLRGTPFLAVNGHLREEHNFGGDLTAQTGWLWRGQSGQVTRLGVHYFNGKSSQYQTFDDSEEQIGFGAWYDF